MYTRELIVHKPNHHHNRLRDEYFLVMGMIFGVLSMVCVTMGLLHYQNTINEVQIENSGYVLPITAKSKETNSTSIT